MTGEEGQSTKPRESAMCNCQFEKAQSWWQAADALCLYTEPHELAI